MRQKILEFGDIELSGNFLFLIILDKQAIAEHPMQSKLLTCEIDNNRQQKNMFFKRQKNASNF